MDILPGCNLDLLASMETYEQTDIRNSNEIDIIEDLIEGAQLFVDKITKENKSGTLRYSRRNQNGF